MYTGFKGTSFRSKAMTGLNKTSLCIVVGQIGIPIFWDYRESILSLCYLFTLFSSFCTVFACISLRHDRLTTVHAAWSIGSGSTSSAVDTNAWIGLSGAVWERQQGSTVQEDYILWVDSDCISANDQDPYCDNCHSAGNTAVGLVLLAAVTRIPSIMLLKARMVSISDTPVIKSLGFFSELLAAISLAGALFVWREYCHKQLPWFDDLDYKYGGGFILVGLGLALTTGLAVIHLLMPTVDPDDPRYVNAGWWRFKRRIKTENLGGKNGPRTRNLQANATANTTPRGTSPPTGTGQGQRSTFVPEAQRPITMQDLEIGTLTAEDRRAVAILGMGVDDQPPTSARSTGRKDRRASETKEERRERKAREREGRSSDRERRSSNGERRSSKADGARPPRESEREGRDRRRSNNASV